MRGAWARTGKEKPRDLAEDTKKDEESTAPSTSGTVCTASQRDDTVVLRSQISECSP